MCVFLNQSKCLCVLWLPRYYRASKKAILVEFRGTRGDRSFTDCVMKVLTSSSKFQKNQKKRNRKENKKKKEKKTMKTKIKSSGVVRKIISKTKLKEKKTVISLVCNTIFLFF